MFLSRLLSVLVVSFVGFKLHALVQATSGEEGEATDLQNRINQLGTPYYEGPSSSINATQANHIRSVIFNYTTDLISQIDWDEAVRELDYTPQFVLSLDGNVRPDNLSLMEATMFSFTASTDMVIAISEIPGLRALMNTSNKSPQYPSIAYLERYLLQRELESELESAEGEGDEEASKLPFRLGRFSTAIGQYMEQITARLEAPRARFVKSLGEYVSSLHDCFRVVEVVPPELVDPEEDWSPPVPRSTSDGASGVVRRYRLVGPTRREVNAHVSKLVVSYFYLPLVAAAFERALLQPVENLSIDDDHAGERTELLKRLERARKKQEESSSVGREERELAAKERDRRTERFAAYADSVVGTAEVLWDLYNATDGRNWIRKGNWFRDPFHGASGGERNEAEVEVEAGRAMFVRREEVLRLIAEELLVTQKHSTKMLAFVEQESVVASNQPVESVVKSIKRPKAPSTHSADYRYDIPETDEFPVVMATFFANWDGLVLDRSSGRVVMLDLMDNGLRGRLPPSLFSLSGNSLTHVELSHNALSGPIPDAFREMANLTSLGLNDNSFTGTLPKTLFGSSGKEKKESGGYLGAQSLSVFCLYNNQLTGSISPHIARLKHLTLVNLSNNKLRGALPSSMGVRLQELRSLDVSHNQLSLSLPSTITKLSSLQLLAMNNNKLSGKLPLDMLVRLSQLRELKIDHNHFSGALPLPTITPIQQGDTEIPAPASFFAACLENLQVQNNHFTGTLSTYVSAFSSLSVLDGGSNRFTGSLPTSINTLQNLTKLSLPNNRFNGSIHGGLSSLAGSLEVLDLRGNNLGGGLSAALFELENLIELRLDDNGFSGRIPKSVGELEKLRVLTLSRNKLTGPIPSRIGSLAQLEMLSLQENRLTGKIPGALLTELTKLRSLVLSDNALAGSIRGVSAPSDMVGMQQLEELVLYGNDDLRIPAGFTSRSLRKVLPRCAKIEL